jgi:hypothetical protein
VAADRRVIRCSPVNHADRSVLLEAPGPIRCLATAQDGSLLAGVDDVGLVHVDGAGRQRVLAGEVAGHRLRSCTAIAVGDGALYFTEGSARHPSADWAWDLMEGHADGRVCRVGPDGGEVEVLQDRLAFPSGVTLSHDRRALLVTEAWTHSMWRLPVGDGASRAARVKANMVGYPGQIHRRAQGGYWLSFFALRTHLVEFVLTQDDYRREMIRTVHPDFWIRPALRTLNSGLEPLQGGGVKKLGVTKPWAPPRSYGLIACVDEDGEVRHSLHSRADGSRHGVLSAREFDGTLYIASNGGDHVLTSPTGMSAP